MNGNYELYGPRGLNALMDQNQNANDYFNSLPETVQAKVIKKAGAISNEDELHMAAQHYLHSK